MMTKDVDCVLRMMRELGYTHQEFAIELGIGLRSLDRYLAEGFPVKVMQSARWVYYAQMGRPFT